MKIEEVPCEKREYAFEKSPRCHAKLRNKNQFCKKPALRGKKRCALHGGKSTGAKTEEGKARSRRGNWKHGFYSAEARLFRSQLKEVLARQ